ncbi:hypothetical protein BCU90_11095 [Vibrio lentus]|uniref:hypothetical protein n=1 Tax=Vibrio lentus TaxID=136468 RepID=UPI000C81BCBF|nr:hypothetical protein [Vibrio lentus]PMG47594.1 hypothetical protein BCU90_11095 [Vibrio lentus]
MTKATIDADKARIQLNLHTFIYIKQLDVIFPINMKNPPKPVINENGKLAGNRFLTEADFLLRRNIMYYPLCSQLQVHFKHMVMITPLQLALTQMDASQRNIYPVYHPASRSKESDERLKQPYALDWFEADLKQINVYEKLVADLIGETDDPKEDKVNFLMGREKAECLRRKKLLYLISEELGKTVDGAKSARKSRKPKSLLDILVDNIEDKKQGSLTELMLIDPFDISHLDDFYKQHLNNNAKYQIYTENSAKNPNQTKAMLREFYTYLLDSILPNYHTNLYHLPDHLAVFAEAVKKSRYQTFDSVWLRPVEQIADVVERELDKHFPIFRTNDATASTYKEYPLTYERLALRLLCSDLINQYYWKATIQKLLSQQPPALWKQTSRQLPNLKLEQEASDKHKQKIFDWIGKTQKKLDKHLERRKSLSLMRTEKGTSDKGDIKLLKLTRAVDHFIQSAIKLPSPVTTLPTPPVQERLSVSFMVAYGIRRDKVKLPAKMGTTSEDKARTTPTVESVLMEYFSNYCMTETTMYRASALAMPYTLRLFLIEYFRREQYRLNGKMHQYYLYNKISLETYEQIKLSLIERVNHSFKPKSDKDYPKQI